MSPAPVQRLVRQRLLGSVTAREALAIERQRDGRAHRLHAGKSGQTALQQPVEALALLQIGIAGSGKRQPEGENALGVESRVDVLQFGEATNHQPRTYQQDNGKGHLADDDAVAEELLTPP